MRIIVATALLLMATACERSKTPSRASAPASTQSIPAAPVSANPVAADSSVAPVAKTGAAAQRAGTAASRPRSVAQRAGAGARAYDNDPPPFDDQVQGNDAASDFQSEQEQRDRELLERDAQEALARGQDDAGNRDGYEDRAAEYDGMQAPEDFPPTDEGDDEPPFEDEYPVESEFPPEDEYPLDDGY